MNRVGRRSRRKRARRKSFRFPKLSGVACSVMRKASNEGGDSRRGMLSGEGDGRKGRFSPRSAFIPYVQRRETLERRIQKRANRQNKMHRWHAQAAVTRHYTSCSIFGRLFFFPTVRSFARLSAGLFEKYRRLLCQLLIKTTTGCAARTTG